MDYQKYHTSHLSHANTQIRSSTTRKTCHSTNHPTNSLHQNIDGIDQNVHELYFILQKDMVSKAKSVGDDSQKRRRIICKATFAILCSRDCVRCSNRIRVLAEKSYQAKKCLNMSFGHLVHALMGLHMIYMTLQEVQCHIIDSYNTRWKLLGLF